MEGGRGEGGREERGGEGGREEGREGGKEGGREGGREKWLQLSRMISYQRYSIGPIGVPGAGLSVP